MVSRSFTVNAVDRLHFRNNSVLAVWLCKGKAAVTCFHFPCPGVIPAPPNSFCQVRAWNTDRSSSAGFSPSTTVSSSPASSPAGRVWEIAKSQSFRLSSLAGHYPVGVALLTVTCTPCSPAGRGATARKLSRRDHSRVGPGCGTRLIPGRG